MKKRRLFRETALSFLLVIAVGIYFSWNIISTGFEFVKFKPTKALDPLTLTQLSFIQFGLDIVAIGFVILVTLVLNPIEYFYNDYKKEIKNYLIKLLHLQRAEE